MQNVLELEQNRQEQRMDTEEVEEIACKEDEPSDMQVFMETEASNPDTMF